VGELLLRSAATSRVTRRIALVVGVVLVATASVGGAAGSVGGAAGSVSVAAGENATASEDAAAGEPHVVDAAVHELDDGRAVLVVVVETDSGVETVVTDLDGERGDADRSDAEPAPSVDEAPDAIDIANLSDEGVENVSGDGIDLSNGSSDPLSGKNLTGADGIAGATGNGSPADADAPGAISGDLIDGALFDVPDALRSPPERLTRAVSREPAFGGGWLLPGALAALGAAMATLGVGALAIWRRTI